MGLDTERQFYRLIDAHEREVPLPPDGFLLSKKLADMLGAAAGDVITAEILEGKRPIVQAPITGLIVDYQGTNAYMNAAALHRLLKEGGTVTGAFLSVDWALMTDIIPKASSGRYMGLSNVATTSSTVIAVATAGLLLDAVNINFGLGLGPRAAYLLGAAYYVIAALTLRPVVEPARSERRAAGIPMG